MPIARVLDGASCFLGFSVMLFAMSPSSLKMP